MATLHNSYELQRFRVVHPLADAPEEKCQTEGLGPIAMTRTVRFSLMALRAYLLFMFGLLLWRVFQLAGFAGHPH